MLQFLQGITEEQSRHSYEPGKWTIREVLNHVNDGERVFLYRAFWFARGYQDALPSFDQDQAVVTAQANNTSWADLVEEFRNVRLSTISFFKSLPEEAWSKKYMIQCVGPVCTIQPTGEAVQTTADAASLLGQVDVPTLVIIGKKDLQVDWQDDGEPLQRAAAGHANVTILFPENANHILKEETKPRSELSQPEALPRYNAPDARLDPAAMASILSWLAAHS